MYYFPVRDGTSGPCIGIVTRPHLEAVLQAASTQGGLATAGALASEEIFPYTEMCSGFDAMLNGILPSAAPGPSGGLPLYRIMDPTPFAIVEDMPAPRLYALFAKAGERAACVTSLRGELGGIISRDGLIAASRGDRVRGRVTAGGFVANQGGRLGA